MAEPSDPTTDPQGAPDSIAAAFVSTIEKHGFGFQYAVREHIRQFRKGQTRSVWEIEDEELPVQCRNKTTSIDLVLRHRASTNIRVIAECKRIEREPLNWFFIQTPLLYYRGGVFFEHVRLDRDKEGRPRVTTGLPDLSDGVFWPDGPVFGLGFPKGKDPTPLDLAVAQAHRGASGYINRFRELAGRLSEFSTAVRIVVPVVFTTARLWGSEVQLTASDLSTGRVPSASFVQHSWVWLRQNISPDLKHDLPGVSLAPGRWAEWTFHDYARCVAIVSVSGIDEFLGHAGWEE